MSSRLLLSAVLLPVLAIGRRALQDLDDCLVVIGDVDEAGSADLECV